MPFWSKKKEEIPPVKFCSVCLYMNPETETTCQVCEASIGEDPILKQGESLSTYQPQQIFDTLKRGFEDLDDLKAWHYAARIAADPVAKVECCLKALEINPDFYEAFKEASRAYKKTKDYENRIKNLLDALDIKPDDIESWLMLGDAHLENRDIDSAVKAFEEAKKNDERVIKAWEMLGVIQRIKMRLLENEQARKRERWGLDKVWKLRDESFKSFKKVMEINPNHPVGIVGWNYGGGSAKGRFKKYVKNWKNPEFFRYAIRPLTLFDTMLKRFDLSPNKWAYDWTVYFCKGQLELAPNDFDTLHDLVLNLIWDGKLGDAESYAKKLVEAHPKRALSYLVLGEALLHREKEDEGVEAFRKALKLDPKQEDWIKGIERRYEVRIL